VLPGQVYHVNRDNPFISGTLSRLTVDLDETVKEFTALYSRCFMAYEKVARVSKHKMLRWQSIRNGAASPFASRLRPQ